MDFYVADSIVTFITVSVFATIFFLFFKRGLRQAYFYLWTLGWGLTLLHYLSQVIGELSPVGVNFAFFMDRLLLSFSVLVFFLSAREFLGLRRSRVLLAVLGALFAIFSYIFIYHAPAEPKVILTAHWTATAWNILLLLLASPLNLLLGGVLFSTGILFFRARKQNRSIGLQALTYAFFVWGTGFLALPFLGRWDYIMPMVSQLLNLPKPIVAMAMIIYLFEQEENAVQEHRDEAVRQRDFVQSLMDSAYDSIYLTDRKGKFQWANKACERLLSISSDDLRERHYTDFVVSEDQPLVEQAGRLVANGIQQSLEVRVQTEEGKPRSMQVVLTPIRDAQNRVTGFLTVGRDVTEINTMERQLRHAEKLVALGRMISGVAHELNNPLTTMMGFSELSLQDKTLEPRYRQRFELILQAATRSKKIVESLQNFVRVPEHKVEPIEVNDLVAENLNHLEKDFQAQKINTRLRFGNAAMCVEVDRSRVGQVLQSIMKNAMEAINEIKVGGTITVATEVEGENTVISISDDGPGIKEPQRIFEPFYTTKEVGKGAGMALSVSYSILQHYGGKIVCENNPQGGAIFRIILPLAPMPTTANSGWSAEPRQSSVQIENAWKR